MKENNELLEIITHDLKSPLTVLKGTVDFLSYEDDYSYKKDAIKILKRSLKNMEDMIDSILVATLIEDKNALVELKEYCKNFKYEMKSKGIVFKTYIQRNIPKVSLDMKRVKNHILNNIITNAIKFTPKGGTIKLSAFEDVDDVVIVIEDSGPGIPINERDNVFFKRKKLSTKSVRSNKSFGLGLYNAHYFTKLNGGVINISDSQFNKGASFTIRFPRLKNDAL